MAQDYAKAEIFGGYQYLHLGGDFTGLNTNGWNASLTGNFSKHLGLAADFGGAYKSVGGVSTHVYSYTGGPVVSMDAGGKINPFAHALFGGATFGGGGTSVNAFTMMFGGGVDAQLNKAFSIRVVQFDWVYYRHSGVSEDSNVRLSTGVVVTF